VLRRLLPLALAAVLCSTGEAPAAVGLKQRSLVNAEVVRLGDLFDGVAARADDVVGKAPAPGETLVFDALRLAALARSAALDWTPANRHVRALIERAGRTLERTEIETAVSSALREQGLPQNYRADLAGRSIRVVVAPGSDAAISIREVNVDREHGRFSAIADISVDADTIKSVSLAGRVYPVVQVPVLARILRPGEVIRTTDLEFIEVAADRVGRDVLIEPGDIAGRAPRRQLAPSAPLRQGDIQPPVLVSKGALVELVVQMPNMVLTAKVRAAEDGALGETVRVVNVRSDKTVVGVVDGPGRVIVPMSAATPQPRRVP
jgi:flagella basal body P-ring formation protein FlgA